MSLTLKYCHLAKFTTKAKVFLSFFLFLDWIHRFFVVSRCQLLNLRSLSCLLFLPSLLTFLSCLTHSLWPAVQTAEMPREECKDKTISYAQHKVISSRLSLSVIPYFGNLGTKCEWTFTFSGISSGQCTVYSGRGQGGRQLAAGAPITWASLIFFARLLGPN